MLSYYSKILLTPWKELCLPHPRIARQQKLDSRQQQKLVRVQRQGISFGAVVFKGGCSHSRGMQDDPIWDPELDPGTGIGFQWKGGRKKHQNFQLSLCMNKKGRRKALPLFTMRQPYWSISLESWTTHDRLQNATHIVKTNSHITGLN